MPHVIAIYLEPPLDADDDTPHYRRAGCYAELSTPPDDDMSADTPFTLLFRAPAMESLRRELRLTLAYAATYAAY